MPCAAPASMTLRLYPLSAQALATPGWRAASSLTTSRPPVVSCTLAAVTSRTRSRPSVSVAMCRFRPLIFFPASIPCEDSGTLPEVRIDWASRIAALGSALRPARLRPLRRRLSLIASVLAHLPPQLIMDRLRQAAGLPLGVIVIDRLEGREIVRQVLPGDPGPVHVQDRVHDLAQVMHGLPQAQPGFGPGRTPGSQDRLDQHPAGIG